jgi:thioredoxin 1
MKTWAVLGLVCGGLVVLAAGAGAVPMQPLAQTVERAYPGLATGLLSDATLMDLTPGVLVAAGPVQVTTKDLSDLVSNAPAALRPQVQKNAFYLVEQLATQRLLLLVARQAAAQAGKNVAGKADKDILDDYLKGIASRATVTDAEVQEYYDENKAAFGNATLPQVAAQVRQAAIEEKQGELVAEHIANLGKGIVSVVSASWAREQAVAGRGNPISQARASGRPTVVAFVAAGNPLCDKMAPILQAARAQYAAQANLLTVDLQQESILAARYGVLSAPAQIFFDKEGKEASRHSGLLSQEELEGELKELGVN